VPSQRLRCITHLGEEGTPHKYGSLPHSEGRGFEEDLVVRRVRTTHSAMVGEVRAALSRLRIRPYIWRPALPQRASDNGDGLRLNDAGDIEQARPEPGHPDQQRPVTAA
jgi:hypothetical protein